MLVIEQRQKSVWQKISIRTSAGIRKNGMRFVDVFRELTLKFSLHNEL
jgi:hypothetical protein